MFTIIKKFINRGRDKYNKKGYDKYGYNRAGYNRDGYDLYTYNAEGKTYT